jgi:hypothetical protein
MTQYIVFKGLKYSGQKDEKEINKTFKKKKWGKVKFKTQFKTKAGQGGGGGRNDVVFLYSGKSSAFYVERFQFGISWLGDYVNNNKDIIPEPVLSRLRLLVKKTGDYGESDDITPQD